MRAGHVQPDRAPVQEIPAQKAQSGQFGLRRRGDDDRVDIPARQAQRLKPVQCEALGEEPFGQRLHVAVADLGGVAKLDGEPFGDGGVAGAGVEDEGDGILAVDARRGGEMAARRRRQRDAAAGLDRAPRAVLGGQRQRGAKEKGVARRGHGENVSVAYQKTPISST